MTIDCARKTRKTEKEKERERERERENITQKIA